MNDSEVIKNVSKLN